ncbi:MAG: GyrI-like domain-containing protein [Pseudorhodobacter sp.]|nr:GyrI-like domain-containing protein [Pseudorhodobacter sp.]
MEKLDFKTADKAFYSGKTGRFDRLTLPPMRFLMVDGSGDPNLAPAYGHAVSALYGLSYGLKFAAKALGKDHTVGPLEGLWWADDMADFEKGRRDRWRWTMMIRQPEWITDAMLEAVRVKMLAKVAKDPKTATTPDMVQAVRFEPLTEGDCLQVLHIGSYADEAPVIARLHQEIAVNGLRPTGKHHEIYLNDPRKVSPEKLKTILRQSVGI